jgi:signal transduction histidine kinase
MSLRTLRWLTILAPALFLFLLELARALLIEPRFPGLLAHLVGAPIILIGILGFSIWVFRRLEAQQRRILEQNRALQALNAAGLSLTADLSLDSVLRRVADEARTLTDARYAALGVLDERGQLDQFLTSGLSAAEEARIGHLPRGHGLLGLLIEDPRPLRLANMADDPRSAGFCQNHPTMTSFLGVPIANKGRAIGNLYLADKESGAEFTERDEAAVVTLAAQAAIAIENARLYRQVRRLAAVEERERIGRELHDGVIQSIYGAGLALDDALHTMQQSPTAGQDKVRRVMAALDRTIAEIRTFIMRLEAREQTSELAQRLADLVEEYGGAGPRIELAADPRAGEALPAESIRQLVQVAREALANAIQHSGAGRIELGLRLLNDAVELTVTDDGRGFDPAAERPVGPDGRGRGLPNLRQRLLQLGGRLELDSAPGQGTTVRVLVPAAASDTPPAPTDPGVR